jgi:AcrR family transcriptional regulator
MVPSPFLEVAPAHHPGSKGGDERKQSPERNMFKDISWARGRGLDFGAGIRHPGCVPYPVGHREEVRQRIVRSAQALFNRHGFDAVSIDDVMARAGLTRGGFYSYFKTKGDLYAEAVAQVVTDHPVRRWGGLKLDLSARDAAQQIVRAYLSKQHLDDIEGSCPMVALPSDVSRSGLTVRRAFEEVFKGMVAVIERGLDGERRGDRDRALAVAAISVGGMVVARSIVDADLAEALRAAATKFALELGAWRPRRAPGRRRGARRPRR